jgi:hypothetical protein
MRHLSYAVLLGFALPAAGLTLQGGQAKADEMPTAEQQVTAVIDRWAEAEANHDRAALEEIIDPAALFTYQSGKTGGRDEFIDMILKADIKPYSLVHEAVLVDGDTAVSIATGLGTKFTTILVRRDGRWRAISETFSKGPEAP